MGPPPRSTVVSPASWPQTCSLHPKEFYEPWPISAAELHSFEMILGKKKGGITGKREHTTKIPQRYCPTYTDISRNWPQIRQPGEAPVFPCSTGGARAEKRQGHAEIRIWRLCASGTLGGFKARLGCQGSRQERCCSPPGKHRASRELPAAPLGAN